MKGYIRKILNSEVAISLHSQIYFLDSKHTSQESSLVLQNIQCPTIEESSQNNFSCP